MNKKQFHALFAAGALSFAVFMPVAALLPGCQTAEPPVTRTTNAPVTLERDIVITFESLPAANIVKALREANAVQEANLRWRIIRPDFTNKAVLDALKASRDQPAEYSND